MTYGIDPYNTPEQFGLEIVAVLDEGGGYDWDLTVLWRDIDTGSLFWYQGAGCSCDDIGQAVRGLGDLNALDREADMNRLIDQVLKDTRDREKAHRFIGALIRAIKEPYTPPVLTTAQKLLTRFPGGDAPIDEVAKFIDEELLK